MTHVKRAVPSIGLLLFASVFLLAAFSPASLLNEGCDCEFKMRLPIEYHPPVRLVTQCLNANNCGFCEECEHIGDNNFTYTYCLCGPDESPDCECKPFIFRTTVPPGNEDYACDQGECANFCDLADLSTVISKDPCTCGS